jgi:hypothetical protein
MGVYLSLESVTRRLSIPPKTRRYLQALRLGVVLIRSHYSVTNQVQSKGYKGTRCCVLCVLCVISLSLYVTNLKRKGTLRMCERVGEREKGVRVWSCLPCLIVWPQQSKQTTTQVRLFFHVLISPTCSLQ